MQEFYNERVYWRDVIPAVVALGVSVLGIFVMISQPIQGQHQLAIVLPPWEGAAAAISLVSAAGGTLVDAGGLPNVFIVTSDRPDFPRALYRAGAWFVMNPIGAHGCLAISPKSGTSL